MGEARADHDESEPVDWEEFPLFAPAGTQVPQLSSNEAREKPPAIAALSHLMHDEESPEERSELLRDQANRLFKTGERRNILKAVQLYSDAIACAPQSSTILAPAYSNRAAAHLKLENYASSIADSEKSLEFDRDNVKALYRIATAELALERPAKALARIAEARSLIVGNDILSLRQSRALDALESKASAQLKSIEARVREKREREFAARNSKHAWEARLRARGVKLGRFLFAQQRNAAVTAPRLADDELSVSSDKSQEVLIWPAIFVYPEEVARAAGEDDEHMEVIEDWHEHTTIRFQLARVFGDDADLNALEVLYRKQWTSLAPFAPYKPSLLAKLNDNITNLGAVHFDAMLDAKCADDVDDDHDEKDLYDVRRSTGFDDFQRSLVRKFGDAELDDTYVGSLRGPSEVGAWVSVDLNTSLRSLLSRSDYIVPGFPVLYIVPRGFRPLR